MQPKNLNGLQKFPLKVTGVIHQDTRRFNFFKGKFGLELFLNELHSNDMTTPAPATIDYGNIITDATLEGRKQASEALQPVIDMFTRSLLDAGFVTLLGVALIAAILLIVGAFRSGRFHVAVPCLGMLAVLGVAADHLLSTITLTWGSAGLGFLLIVAAVAKGWRGLLNLARILTP